jgi:hypothetical protein
MYQRLNKQDRQQQKQSQLCQAPPEAKPEPKEKHHHIPKVSLQREQIAANMMPPTSGRKVRDCKFSCSPAA